MLGAFVSLSVCRDLLENSYSPKIWSLFYHHSGLLWHITILGGISPEIVKRLWKKFCQLWSQGTRWHQTSTACVDASTRTCLWAQHSLMSPAETRPAIGTPSLAIQSFPHLRKVAFMSCFPDCFFYITCQVWESLWDRANSSLRHQQCGPPNSSWPWIWDVYRVAQTRCFLFFTFPSEKT